MDRCTLRNLGGSAVVVSGGVEHTVSGCEIHDVGRGGVLLSGGDRTTLEPARHAAVDNHIHHFARRIRTYQPAIRLSGVGLTAAHNLVHDAPHTALLFGGNDHVIELNHFHDVCLETGDVGVIYTGRDWTARGTVIRWNLIRDCEGPGLLHGAQGIYLDDCASGIEVYGNVLWRVYRGMLIGGGRDNMIRNNLMVECDIPVHIDARALGWMRHHVQEDGTLMVRLREMPYQSPPWSERYPELVNILDDEPAAPKGNVLERNLMVQCGEMEIHDPVRAGGTIGMNLRIQSADEAPDLPRIEAWIRPGGRASRELPGFEPIPIERIGPRTPDPDGR